MPRAWTRWVRAVGTGALHVKSAPGDDRREWLAREHKDDPFRSGRSVEFELAISEPGMNLLRAADGDLEDEATRAVWFMVGHSPDGDSLVVGGRPLWLPPALDDEVVWWNHEGGGFVYRWPSVRAYLAGMLELAETGEQIRVLDLRAEAREARWRRGHFDEPKRLNAHVPPLPARPRGALRCVTCPHCGHHFSLTSGLVWDGEVHAGCGKRIVIVEEGADRR